MIWESCDGIYMDEWTVITYIKFIRGCVCVTMNEESVSVCVFLSASVGF